MTRNIIKHLTLAAAACLALSACEKTAGPDGTAAPLQKWSFSGHEITYKSGIAVRSRDLDGNLVAGLTVWLTDQSIDCGTDGAALPGQGGWIGIKYPEISLGKGLVRVIVGYWPQGGGTGGNLDHQGSAVLSSADTSAEKQVSGSLDFHSPVADPEDNWGKADITGSYSVPYCPEI